MGVPARRPQREDDGRESFLAELRDLAALVAEHGLTEIEIERAGMRIRVVRERAPAGLAPAAPLGEIAARAGSERESPVPSHLLTMEAPMVGTFYRAPNPQAAPYVNEGDMVKEGQVMCIIEAMKLMNEIEAKASGRVTRILVENAQPVEYGQPLFLIDPRA
jgi:acetyl-CoA carboxylase biotin carboxyl carrier protein